ncbi:PROTEIN RESTRICTED TEV MOVEMENT 2 [Salix purpurea]|uniref:PROTEIN RESTRICTED TEV MOVEMENT 2 n=1 Tax=Salix purpurea TaxID=77065 RepID=A0A9Q0UCQ6_SALPP|nr:PROTEIN RESTRICTED TEV MOVEMENT 2 [Salix purpurea]
MAMRTRTGGSAAAIQYENFQPKSERQEEEGETVLLIYLPDFLKKQLKIAYVHSSRIVRVTGERPLEYNKWSRFNQTFPVPQNCEVNKIQGKFQDGILFITMPKDTTKQSHPKEESKGTKDALLPSKDALPEKTTTSQVSQKPKMETKAQKGMEDAAGFSSPKQTDGQKVVSTTDTMKQRDEKTGQFSSDKTVDQKPMIVKKERTDEVSKKLPTESVKEKTLSEQEEIIRKRKESLATEGDESRKKRKEPVVAGETSSLRASDKPDKEKSGGFAGAGAGAEEKTKQDFNVAGKVKEVKNVAAAAAKKTVKGLGTMELSEERQSMVNMGVAVLVIVALGAYVVYSYRSSGTSKD